MKIIIVDDEINACKNIEHVLFEHFSEKVEIVGIAHNTHDAEILIQSTQPDVLFLDIEMPEENAFNFIDRISPINFEIVFVTAYDEFAIRAFKLNAVDYILKPISTFEVETAISRLEEKITFRRLKREVKTNYHDLDSLLSGNKQANKIILRENNVIEVVSFKDILFIEGKGSYSNVTFYNNGRLRTMLMSNNVAEYEILLPAEAFFRIHKSYIVNGIYIESISTENGIYAILKDSIILPVGRRRYSALLSFLKKNDFR